METDAPLPEGTVTFLFTDIEGSTRLLQHLGEGYLTVLEAHRRLLRDAFQAWGGHELGTEGDALFVAFPRAPDALAAAAAAQRALAAHPWPEGASLRVRIGLHSGEPLRTAREYVGLDLHRAARIRDAAHGGQILLSQRTRDLAEADLPAGVSFRDLGSHRLKDLQAPEHLFQLVLEEQPGEFRPPRSLEAVVHNLPLQLTRFIGREGERAAVKELLGTARLVTLMGVGGSGKTRLALQVAAELIEDYGDGVWFVELAALSDPALVPQEVAAALGIREEPGRPMLATLADDLRSKHLLLVLDNCEHLLGASAALAHTLLRASPGLQILTTSRELLGVKGERTYPVPALSLPDARRLPPVEQLTEYDAVKLFLERAVDSQPSFEVTLARAPAVVEVCRRLEGIPLAIELAAARLRVLSIEQIAARLEDRFRLLTGGSREVLPRQQTLRATMDWSYDLLSEGERVLLRRLSVFAGGFGLAEAESICTGEGIQANEILDLLEELVDKSLVIAEGRDAEVRYRLLETIRQYGAEKLREAGEEAGLQRFHRDWYLGLAEAAETELLGRDQKAWLERLEREHDNLRAALAGAQTSDAEVALRLAGALWRFWEMRGHFTEARGWLEGALERSAGGSVPARAKALTGAGTMVWHQGEYERAAALHGAALILYRELDDKRGIAFSLNNLAAQASAQGDYERTESLLHESMAIFQEIGDRNGILFPLYNLGVLAAEQGDNDRAIERYTECLELARAIGNKRVMASSLSGLGTRLKDAGDYECATLLLTESLALARELGDKEMIAYSLVTLGTVAHRQENHMAAQALFAESLALWRELGDRRGLALCLEALAGLRSATGDAKRGARLLGAAEALREAISAPRPLNERPDYERSVALARAALSEPEFSAACTAGRSMTLEEVLADALPQAGDA